MKLLNFMAPKKKNEKTEQYSNVPSSINTIFGIDLSGFNINSEWLKLVNTLVNPKVSFNIILITTIFLAQLTTLNGLTTEVSMQSEIHRTVMRILNSEEILSFITAIVIGSTEKYSLAFKSTDTAERFRELKNARGARNSRFNNVIPSIGMTTQALMKYCIGYRFSINGILSTHPIFYGSTLSNWYGLSTLDINLEKIKSLTNYKEEFAEAVTFIQKKIKEKNPHLESVDSFQPTTLQTELGLYVESTQTKSTLELLPEDEGSEEERQRARLINEQIKLNNQ